MIQVGLLPPELVYYLWKTTPANKFMITLRDHNHQARWLDQNDSDSKKIQSAKTKAEKEAQKSKSKDTAPPTETSSTVIPPPKKEEQASAPLQSTPLQNHPITPQNSIPESSSSGPKIVFHQNKEGQGIHVLEFEYPPNSDLDFPIELEEHDFRLKNGDIILLKENSFTFLVAKKRQKWPQID